MTLTLGPVDARLAKIMLRAYAVVIPAAALIGGYCSLLQMALITLPDGAVDHIPTFIKVAAFFVSVAWWYWLYRTFRRLPGIIDDILDRGISMAAESTSQAAVVGLKKARQTRPLNMTCAEPSDS